MNSLSYSTGLLNISTQVFCSNPLPCPPLRNDNQNCLQIAKYPLVDNKIAPIENYWCSGKHMGFGAGQIYMQFLFCHIYLIFGRVSNL